MSKVGNDVSPAVRLWGEQLLKMMPLPTRPGLPVIPVMADDEVRVMADITCTRNLDHFALAIHTATGWIMLEIEDSNAGPLTEPTLVDVTDSIRDLLRLLVGGTRVQICEAAGPREAAPLVGELVVA